jgi:transposase
MLSANVEQCVNIKFLIKLGKSATETYNLLTEVYGDQCLSRTQVFEWFKKFKEGREYVGDDPKSGRPSTAKTQENVEKVARIVRGDRRLSIRATSELTNINKESVRQILHDDLGMK